MERRGTARLKGDGKAYLDWYRSLTREQAGEYYRRTVSEAAQAEPQGRRNPVSEAVLAATESRESSWLSEKAAESAWRKKQADCARSVESMLRYARDYGQPLRVRYWADGLFACLYLGNPSQCVAILEPERFLEFEPEPDYSDLTPAQVRSALSAPRGTDMNTMPAQAEQTMTRRGMEQGLTEQRERLAGLDREMEDVKRARTGELAELQAKIEAMTAELDARKARMMASLEEKKREMEAVRERMELEIHLLDSQIYAIRCFAGEVVQFTRIRSGRNAPDTEPIVVHQKLRFLDEDLGRLASIYEIQWEEVGMFEEFLRHSPLALETFAPDPRCVQLVRLSRTGVQQGRNDKYPYANLMRDFEYFHGRTVGILIRNGENLYLGWTDQERVDIQDDLLITAQPVDIQPQEPRAWPESDWERENRKKREREERMELLDGLLSRTFVYNILQGVVEHSDILPLPEGYTLGRQSEYVVYALADKWLADTRFGSFTDIIETGNRRITVGDRILTVQAITPERENRTLYSPAWHNARGRGEMNRTHDCKAEDCTIYPVNLIEQDAPVQMVRYRWKPISFSGIQSEWRESVSDRDTFDRMEGEKEVLEEFEQVTQHVYVSLPKNGYYRDYKGEARANVELYEHEYINLTYLNSVWLEWVVNTKTLGDWRVHDHPVDYAYAIRYVKTALDYVRRREAEEKAFLDAVDPSVCQDADWPLRLSQWKLEAGVRAINPFQAKRFVKYIKTAAGAK